MFTEDDMLKHKVGRAVVRIPVDQIIAAIEADDNLGFCLHCGEEAYGVEPDARGYKCESCGNRQVYSAEELLMMGAGE